MRREVVAIEQPQQETCHSARWLLLESHARRGSRCRRASACAPISRDTLGVEGVAEVRGRGGRVPTRMLWVSGMEVATEATADAPPPRGCDEEKKIGAASLRIAAPT